MRAHPLRGLHRRILGWSQPILERVANFSPGIALILVHVLHCVGLLKPGPSPEQIAEILSGEAIHPRELRRISRSMRLTRAKNHALAKLEPERLAAIIRLRGVELLRQQPGRPSILVFWHMGASPRYIAAAMANEHVPVVVARARQVSRVWSQAVLSVSVGSSEGGGTSWTRQQPACARAERSLCCRRPSASAGSGGSFVRPSGMARPRICCPRAHDPSPRVSCGVCLPRLSNRSLPSPAAASRGRCQRRVEHNRGRSEAGRQCGCLARELLAAPSGADGQQSGTPDEHLVREGVR